MASLHEQLGTERGASVIEGLAMAASLMEALVDDRADTSKRSAYPVGRELLGVPRISTGP